MSSISSFAHIIHGVLFAIGMILIVSSTQKLRAPHRWHEDLAAYRILPSQRFIWILARTVVVVESGLGSILVVQLFPAEAALAATLLFCAFLTVTSVAIMQGRVISCGCVGAGSRRSLLGVRTVVRLSVLAGAAGLCFVYTTSVEPLQSQDLGDLVFRIGSGIAFGIPLVLLFFLIEIVQDVLHMARGLDVAVDTTSTRKTTS